MVLADVFGPDIFIALIAVFCGLVVPIWAIADAASRPAVAFYGAGSNKTAWIVVIAVALIFGFGLFLGGFYLLFTRRKVLRYEQLGSGEA
jgi:hypothetical protein